MPDVQYSDSDFTTAVTELRAAAARAADGARPDNAVVKSDVVEAALGDVDELVRAAMDALSEAGDELATDTGVVHSELQRTDAELAGGGA